MTDNIGAAKLRSYVERRARLDGEVDALKEDIKALDAEVSGDGYSKKAFNMAVRRYRMSEQKRQEAEQVQSDFYLYWGTLQGGEE